jgi:hypothetical protein
MMVVGEICCDLRGIASVCLALGALCGGGGGVVVVVVAVVMVVVVVVVVRRPLTKFLNTCASHG